MIRVGDMYMHNGRRYIITRTEGKLVRAIFFEANGHSDTAELTHNSVYKMCFIANIEDIL